MTYRVTLYWGVTVFVYECQDFGMKFCINIFYLDTGSQLMKYH